jgi:transcription initiation factor IIE alpha subunit
MPVSVANHAARRQINTLIEDTVNMGFTCEDCGQKLSSSEYKRHQETHLQTRTRYDSYWKRTICS